MEAVNIKRPLTSEEMETLSDRQVLSRMGILVEKLMQLHGISGDMPFGIDEYDISR